jgi:hypothetical protein
MSAAVSVGPGMAVGGVVAASHLPALQADAQMQPLPTGGQALLAAFDRVWKPRDPNVIEVAAGGHLPTQPRRLARNLNENPFQSSRYGVLGVCVGSGQGEALVLETPA